MRFFCSLLLFCMMLISSSAQDYGKYGRDSAQCVQYLSFYKEYYNLAEYKEALKYWEVAYKVCPSDCRVSIYTDGAELYRWQLDQSISNNKTKLLSELLDINMQRAMNFRYTWEDALMQMRQDLRQYADNDKFKEYYEKRITAMESEFREGVMRVAVLHPLFKGDELRDIEKVVLFSGIAESLARTGKYDLFMDSSLFVNELKLPVNELGSADIVCNVEVIYENGIMYVAANLTSAKSGKMIATVSDDFSYTSIADIELLNERLKALGEHLAE